MDYAFFYYENSKQNRALANCNKHLSDIDFKDFMIIHKKRTAEKYYFLVNGTTLSSDNSLHFRKHILEGIYNKIMTSDDQTKDEKLQYDINREAAKI